MKQFNDTAILTSKNPEAFLNFTYDLSQYWIIPDCCIGNKILYINGLDINNYSSSLGYALQLDATNNIASFHVYANVNYKFDTNLTFYFYDVPNISTGTFSVLSYDISILNRPYIIPTNVISNYNNEDILIDDETSYMLMRTNPKLTGNIAIFVDISNNIFLDTFKISDTLSNKKYRHQQISANSVLSSDIRKVFSSMPLGELYKVDEDDTLSIAIPKTEYKDQYKTTYNYGARLIKDELYIEDYGLLAPLWINYKLPDYFAIFRLNGVYNIETYNSSSLVNLASDYLKQSNLIKSWSLKIESPLGKYLNTHLIDLLKIQAPVFLSLTDPSILYAESDPNTWYGVAVDKGILTGRSETPYFFNKKSANFTDLNAFVSQGFERNTLVCPNLLNLQYIFNDEDVSLYSMHRYFGLYLTENVLYKIAYYSDVSNGPITIISLDNKDSSILMHSSIFDVNGNIISTYQNRIFVLNDEVQLQRITNVNQINDACLNSYVSKPYKNIFSTNIEKTNIQPFITLTINNLLEQGEHLRIINKTQNKIWEVYSTDVSAYNNCDIYCSIFEDASKCYPIVYRTYFDINGTIYDQCREIQKAFDRFTNYEGTYFRTGLYGNNWVSLILNDDACTSEKWMFQRITAATLNNFNEPLSGFNNAALPSDITFWGRFTPTASDFEIITYNASYGPINFELYGNRQSIMLDFFNRQTNNLYSFDSSQNILDKFEETVLYQGTDYWYKKIINFDVSNNSYQYVKDPLHLDDKVLIMTKYEINTIKNRFNAYSIYPLTISLMGINPVKDIDYTVYDSCLGFISEYWYKREDDVSSYYISIDACSNYNIDIPGSYIVQSGVGILTQNSSIRNYSTSTLFNTFDSSVNLQAITNTLVTYAILNGSYNYKSYDTSLYTSEETIKSYYDSSILLKYGLTVPLTLKWVGLGTDCRNNPIRLILDNSIFDVSSNFVANSTTFSEEISYPVYKYLTPGERAWQSYIFYDINDIADASNNLTFKEAMLQYPYVDYFSKLLYSNYNVNATKTRSSIVYYNGYKNSLDTIITGLNLSIKIQDVAKSLIDIKNYDRYRFSFISTSSKNKDTRHPIEVIINENIGTILMIWYQGNDELNYNKRYSTFLPGKSLLDPSNYGFITSSVIDSSYYCFVKTPYYVNNSTISKKLINLYTKETTYDNSTAKPYAQFNINSLNDYNSIWNAFGNNSITGTIINSPKSYNTFLQYISYAYNQNINTYKDYVANYGYHYNSNENFYTNNTTNINTLTYLLSPTYDHVMYYILRDTNTYTNYDLKTKPLTITINSPRSYRNVTTYNGWFKPKFNSIFEFNCDEESTLIDIVDRDFIFSNTNLRLYNHIPQLWYNKLVSTVTVDDVSKGNAISYISNFNVFKALWDANYFIKDNNYVNGYNSPYELPSFFGSKLIKLPDELIIDSWDTTTANATSSVNEITLSFNLTRAILNKFKSNSVFLSNWAGLLETDNIKDSYIKNTILTYYNLSTSKIKVDFYYKSYDTQTLYYNYDSTFTNNNKQNFNGQMLYENDDYLYKMIIPILGNYSYYVKFTMTEK